jgi:2-phosphosulfolactate phosphatase
MYLYYFIILVILPLLPSLLIMRELPKLEVCLSPALLHLFDPTGTVTVIIDVFRATSTIAAALHNGAKRVIPVAAVEECINVGRRTENSITAGERDGKVAPGLQYGNSPLEYPRHFVDGKTLVLTTTNGTRLLHMVQGADTIATGSFLNLDALCQYLVAQSKPVLLGCAAWKDRFNLEDTLFAGAVVNRVASHFNVSCDSARAARTLESQTGGRYLEYLRDSSHYHRLSAFGLEKDLEYCTSPNLHPVVPILNGKELIAA